jgi:hypothetical protein
MVAGFGGSRPFASSQSLDVAEGPSGAAAARRTRGAVIGFLSNGSGFLKNVTFADKNIVVEP